MIVQEEPEGFFANAATKTIGTPAERDVAIVH